MNLLKFSHKLNRGFSLLEIIVVVVIISILFGLALEHLFKWRITAEQTSVQKLRSEMRDALKLEVATYYAKGQMPSILQLVGSNPLNYAIEKPSSYIGERKRLNLEDLSPGEWVFDSTNKVLIYKVRYPKHFSTKLAGIKRIELKVSLVFADIDKNRRFSQGVDTIEGLRLTSTENYVWNNE